MSIQGYITEKIYDCFMSGVVPIYLGCKNIDEFVKYTCDNLGLFIYECSKDNPLPSLNARSVIDIVNRESSSLNDSPNLWHVYNGFNEVLHNKLKKSFSAQKETDTELFEFIYSHAANN